MLDQVNPTVPIEKAGVKETQNYSGCNWSFAVFVIIGIVGVVITTLGGTDNCGETGSPGFIASTAGGGTLVIVGIVGGVVVLKQKSSNQEKKSYDPEKEQLLVLERQNRLRAALLKRFNVKKRPIRKNLSNINAWEEIGEKGFGFNPPPNTKSFQGGEHSCVTSEDAPVIFKRKIDNDSCGRFGREVEDPVKLSERAKEICERENLYLLDVYLCKQFNSLTIVQEKAKVLGGEYLEVAESYYRWANNDPELQPYMRELYRQLTIFICLTKWSDVKADNMLFTEEGGVALFDLDSKSAVLGLTGSFQGGLFGRIPREWLSECLDEAAKRLTEDEWADLNYALQTRSAENLEELAINAFYQRKSISLPSQPIVFNKQDFKEYDSDIRLFVEYAIKHFNEQISLTPPLSLVGGRKVWIHLQRGSKFLQGFYDLINRGRWNKIYGDDLQKIIDNGIQALIKKGYVFSENNHMDPRGNLSALIITC